MKCDFTGAELAAYTARQLNHFYPDKNEVSAAALQPMVNRALERVEWCFGHILWPTYSAEGEAKFNPLHSDQYCSYLYFLCNSFFRAGGDLAVAGKLFYLNKSLHGFNCMYDTALPDIFWLVHTVGTVLGKADYGDYLVVLQNCTVGAVRGEYPQLGEKIILSAGASIVGRCLIGDNVMVGPNCSIFKRDIPPNSIVTNDSGYALKANSERPIRSCFHLDSAVVQAAVVQAAVVQAAVQNNAEVKSGEPR